MKRALAWAFAAALGVRVALVLWLNFAPPHLRPVMPIFVSDAVVYDALAKSLLAGNGYQYGGDYAGISSLSPLFSCFLAVQYAVWGPSTLGAGLVNSLLGAASAVLLFYIARLAFAGREDDPEGQARADWIALASAWGFALYPLLIFNTPFVLKENFGIFLTMAFVLAWARWLHAWARGVSAVRLALLAGFLLGLSVLCRFPHAGLAAVLLGAHALIAWRSRRSKRSSTSASTSGAALLGQSALALVACLAVLSPWLARNYNIFGQVVLTPHGPARYLYNANSDLAVAESNGYYEGRGRIREHNRALDAQTGLDVRKRERIFAQKAARNFLQKPGHVATLIGAKLVSMWRPVWANSSLRSWIVLGVPYIVMMALALPGLLLALRSPLRRNLALQVLVGVIAFYFIGHALFYGMIRERQYVEPYLIACAAFAFHRLLQRRAVTG